MPLPKPSKNESKDEFIARIMSDEKMKDEYPDKEQRLAIAYSQWKKKGGKETSTTTLGLEIKELDGEFYSEGFIATTHPDRAADYDLGVDGDILSKQVIEQIVEFINSGVATIDDVGSTRTVSLQHDWLKEHNPDMEPAGMVVPPAEVREMEGGHWGAYVKVHHNKSHPQFEEIKYKVEHGYYPGFSIEYLPGDYEVVNVKDKVFRFLKSIKNYVGHAFASARKIANPAALIVATSYKEIEESTIKNEEEVQMADEKEINEALPETESKEEVVVDTPAPEVEQKDELEAVEKEIEEPAKELSETPVEEKEVSIKEVAKSILESAEFKEAIDSIKVESKALKNKGETTMHASIKEMNDALGRGDLASAKEAGKAYAQETGVVEQTFKKALKEGFVGFDSNIQVKVSGKGLKVVGGVQYKDTLVVGDNASTYTQSNVEFADLFAPGIIDTFNNQVNYFGFANKEQHLGGNYYQWKMITDKDPNSISTFVAQTDVNVVKNFSEKKNYQTPIKIARRGVSVSDFMIRYSTASLGDLFALELDLQMKELMNDVNAALFAEVADGTGNAPLGLEAVADSAGNTTLYGFTRSTANRLSPDTAANTYEAIGGSLTEAKLRAKMSYLETEGVKYGDMVIIASPTTRDYLFNLMDGNRRFNTAEATFGFTKATVPVYDGVPIIVDSDCNSDAIYIIDKMSAVIVVAMPPTIVNLAKVGAAVEAYVQMDFAHVYKEPRKISMLDTLSGP